MLCTASNVFTLRNADYFVAIGFSNNKFVIIGIITLKVVAESLLSSEAVSIAFLEDGMLIACTTKEGDLFSSKLLC